MFVDIAARELSGFLSATENEHDRNNVLNNSPGVRTSYSNKHFNVLSSERDCNRRHDGDKRVYNATGEWRTVGIL